jgi:hypothetical protein
VLDAAGVSRMAAGLNVRLGKVMSWRKRAADSGRLEHDLRRKPPSAGLVGTI